MVLQHRPEKVFDKHWFSSICPKKQLKNIGCTASAKKSVEKASVLQYRSEKVLKKQWFYRQGNRKREKTHSLHRPGNRKTIKNHCFCCKTNPCNRAMGRATDSGCAFHILGWIRYEEPLQTSCLGKILSPKSPGWFTSYVRYFGGDIRGCFGCVWK